MIPMFPIFKEPTQLPPDQRSMQGVPHRQITSTKFSESVFCNLSSRASTHDGHLFHLRGRRKGGAISHLSRVSNGAHRHCPLPAKTTNKFSTIIQDIVNFYKSKGHIHRPRGFLQSIGISMQRTGTGCHVKEAERAIRTIKDKCRATKFSLGGTLPRSLHQHLIVDVTSINVNVNSAPFLFQNHVRTTSTTILSYFLFPSEPFA